MFTREPPQADYAGRQEAEDLRAPGSAAARRQLRDPTGRSTPCKWEKDRADHRLCWKIAACACQSMEVEPVRDGGLIEIGGRGMRAGNGGRGREGAHTDGQVTRAP